MDLSGVSLSGPRYGYTLENHTIFYIEFIWDVDRKFSMHHLDAQVRGKLSRLLYSYRAERPIIVPKEVREVFEQFAPGISDAVLVTIVPNQLFMLVNFVSNVAQIGHKGSVDQAHGPAAHVRSK